MDKRRRISVRCREEDALSDISDISCPDVPDFKVKTDPSPIKKRRHKFNHGEDLRMLNYIMEDERLYKIKGIKLWKRMEDLEITKHTSIQSMKYRFLNTVIQNLNCYQIKESWVHQLHSRYPDLVNPKCYQESTKTRSVLECKNPSWSLVRSQPKTHADKEPQLTQTETRAADEEEQQQRDQQQDRDCSDSKASNDFEISKPKVVPKKRTTRHNLSYIELTSSSSDEDPEIDESSTCNSQVEGTESLCRRICVLFPGLKKKITSYHQQMNSS